MKNLVLVMLAAGIANWSAAAGTPAWVWSPSDKDSMQGWTQPAHAEVANRSGVLEFQTTGKDCQLLLPSVRLDPAQYDRVTVYYSTADFTARTLSGQIYFANDKHKFTDADHIRLALKPDQQDGVLTIPLNNNWATGGTVTSLRLDPVDQAPGKVAIRGIVFYNSADFPEPPPLATAKAGTPTKLALWNGGFDDWSEPANLTATEQNGKLVLTLNAPDARLAWKGKPFAPEQYTWLLITAQADGFTGNMTSGQLYYKNSRHGVDGKYFFVLPAIPNDGKEHTLLIELRRNLRHGTVEDFEKGGDITGFRYDPTDSAPGKMEISRFELIGPRQY